MIKIIIDRPLGSRHPEYGFVYPINYGYVPDTKAGDGQEVDAYVLGVDVPLESFEGECIAVIKRLDDAEDKLVVVPSGMQLSDEAIAVQTEFQEQYFTTEITRKYDISRLGISG